MKKKPKGTQKIELLNKRHTWLEWVKNQAYCEFPGKKEWRERFCYTFLTWAMDEESLDILQFCTEYKFPRASVYEWSKKYDEVGQTMKLVRHILAGRKKVGAITRKYDKDAVYKDMHLYDEEYGPLVNEYWNKLRKDEPDKTQTINVIIPDSNTVTKKVQT